MAQPSLKEKISNVAKALIKFTSAGGPLVSGEVYQNRLKICETCDKRVNGWNCEVCGCHLPIKAKMATEECPLKKWLVATQPVKHKSGGCGGCQKK